MTAVTDFANEAAVLTANYKKVQIDRGVGKSPRFITVSLTGCLLPSFAEVPCSRLTGKIAG